MAFLYNCSELRRSFTSFISKGNHLLGDWVWSLSAILLWAFNFFSLLYVYGTEWLTSQSLTHFLFSPSSSLISPFPFVVATPMAWSITYLSIFPKPSCYLRQAGLVATICAEILGTFRTIRKFPPKLWWYERKVSGTLKTEISPKFSKCKSGCNLILLIVLFNPFHHLLIDTVSHFFCSFAHLTWLW